MTAGLSPTARRLALLASIAAGDVTGQASNWWVCDAARVTDGVRRLRADGLAVGDDPQPAARTTVTPTPTGRAVLSEAGRCGGCGRRFDSLIADLDPVPLLRVCAHTTPTRQVVCLTGCPTWELCGDCADGVR